MLVKKASIYSAVELSFWEITQVVYVQALMLTAVASPLPTSNNF